MGGNRLWISLVLSLGTLGQMQLPRPQGNDFPSNNLRISISQQLQQKQQQNNFESFHESDFGFLPKVIHYALQDSALDIKANRDDTTVAYKAPVPLKNNRKEVPWMTSSSPELESEVLLLVIFMWILQWCLLMINDHPIHRQTRSVGTQTDSLTATRSIGSQTVTFSRPDKPSTRG